MNTVPAKKETSSSRFSASVPTMLTMEMSTLCCPMIPSEPGVLKLS
jgi:hypothetical protein